MWRKLFKELVEWKDDSKRMVLLLEGVRQCGKTYLLRELGKECFSNMVYVNFEKDSYAHSLFDKDLDAHRIIDDLGIYFNKDIVPGKTLIVFDEVQECGKAMTSLKYFTEEAPEYHVACAGSLIGLTVNKESFPVGKVTRMRLYPMSFLEFLRAEGEERLFEYLMSKDPSEPMSEAIHSMASGHLMNYYLVGGMPKAVESWVDNRSVPKVTKIQRSLLKDYRDDFVKHGAKIMDELVSIWESIPNQLMKDNRRMILKDVLPRGRSNVFVAPLQWLTNAGLIHCVYQAESPCSPLSEVKDASMFKVYPCDVGLLRAMSGVPSDFVLSKYDEYRLFKGAMAETLVVCAIKSSGYEDDVCYWKSDKNEVDVIVSTSKGVVPIEVKFGNATRGTSLNTYCEKYHPKTSVHLSMNNAKGGDRMFVPLYSCESLIPCLENGYGDHVEPSPEPFFPFTMQFSSGDWEEHGGGYRIIVRRSRHNRGGPSIIQLFKRTGSGGYVGAPVDIEITPEDDVVVSSKERFDGKLSVM